MPEIFESKLAGNDRNKLLSLALESVASKGSEKLSNFVRQKLSLHELEFISRCNAELVADYCEFRMDLATAQSGSTPDFPFYVLVEPASACNYRCPFCFQVDKSFTRKPYMGLMDYSLFCDVVDELVSRGTKAVTLASRGEPTLHPDLPKMLEYLAGKFMEVKLNTNGSLLTEQLSEAILDADVNWLVYSLEAITPADYQKLRVNGDFDKVKVNIERFNELRGKRRASKTITRASGVFGFRDIRLDPREFVNYWLPVVDQVMLVDCEERWDTYNNALSNNDSACGFLSERIYVWWDGQVNPCDVDYKSQLSPGKLDYRNGRNLSYFWNGKKANNLRKLHVEGARSTIEPCRRCDL